MKENFSMKKFYHITLFCLVFCTSLQAQTLYKVENDGLYGYTNATQDTVIVCKYIHAYTDTIRKIGFVFDQETQKIICFNNRGKQLFHVFEYDNGPDYVQEGLFRIMDEKNLIGFADTLGNVVIKPQFKFAYPFQNNRAKVTYTGTSKEVPESKGEVHYWDSMNWFCIDKKGNNISSHIQKIEKKRNS